MTQPDLIDPHPLIDEEVVTNAPWILPPSPELLWCDQCGEGTLSGFCRKGLADCAVDTATERGFIQERLRGWFRKVRLEWIGGRSV